MPAGTGAAVSERCSPWQATVRYAANVVEGQGSDVVGLLKLLIYEVSRESPNARANSVAGLWGLDS